MKPAFLKDGTVTAGTSSGINDGAAALAVMSARGRAGARAEAAGAVVASAVAGVDPVRHGARPDARHPEGPGPRGARRSSSWT